MGERGPVGKRPDMRHGHGAQNDPFDQVAPEPVTWPEPSADWHELARDWYLGLQQSAQVIDFQQSDIGVARIMAEDVSRNLHYRGPMSGNALSAFLSGCSDLLATAGARRRAKLELSRPNTGPSEAATGAAASLAAHRAKRSS